MRKALVVIALLFACVDRPAADTWKWGLGGGYAGAAAQGDTDAFHLNGAFLVLSSLMDSGLFTSATISIVKADQEVVADLGGGPQSFRDEAEVHRADFTVGHQFQLDRKFRPMLHAGLAYLGLEEVVGGVTVISDGSVGFTVGFGFEGGTKHDAFYLDFSKDFGHEISAEFGLGSVTIDFNQWTAGYVHRF